VRADAERRLSDAKVKAERIEVDESHERSRGSLSAQGGVGFGVLSSSEGESSGVLLGGQAAGHLGFWGTAPADGMASGLEVRVMGRYLQLVGGTGAQRVAEGRATIRWFFGRVGVGAAGEVRLVDTTLTLNSTPRSFTGFGVGPSLGIALVDTPSTRLIFNASWMPIGSNDLLRVVGDLDLHWKYFCLSLVGGTTTDPTAQPVRVGFFLAVMAGVRFGW
ncbi:MAG: hypothetical protein JNG84_12970, partial [Archangium sp.]|nr:hypothetical protein [Archangium sp.]